MHRVVSIADKDQTAVAAYTRIRRKHLIQEAEGYLELILAVSGPFPLDASHHARLAERALAALDQLDGTESCQGRAHYLRGQAFRVMGQHHQSIDWLLKAADADPTNLHIHLSLAWCYKRVDRVDLAIQSLERALEIDPEHSVLHYNLACYWSLANNVGLTLAHLARAFETDTTYRQLVAEEPDFDPVREHPEFLALISVIV